MNNWIKNRRYVLLLSACLFMIAALAFIWLGGKSNVATTGQEESANISQITSEQLDSVKKICTLNGKCLVYTHPFGEEVKGNFYYLDQAGKILDAPYALDKFESVKELFSDPDGNLCMMVSKVNDILIKVFDLNGTCIHETNLSEVIEEPVIMSVRRGEEGYLYVLASDEGDSAIYIFDDQNKLVKKLNGLMSTQGCLRLTKDGEIAYIFMAEKNDAAGFQFKVQTYHGTQAVNEYVLPVNNIQNFEAFSDGAFYDLYYCDSSNQIYGYDLKKNKSTVIASLYAMGLNAADMLKYVVLGQADILVEVNHYNKKDFWDRNDLYAIKSGELRDGRSKIVLASMYADGRIQDAVSQFNAGNDHAYIEILDYSSKEDPQKQLVMDLMAGNEVDIIHMSPDIKKQLIEKNVLIDLYPYLKESKLQSALNNNILKILSVDEKLYSICANYTVNGVIGTKEQLASDNTWNINHLVKAQKQNEQFMVNESAEELLETLLANNYDYLIDYNTKSCRFDSEEFQNLLELSQALADKRLEYAENYVIMEFIMEGIQTDRAFGVDFRKTDLDILNYQLFSNLYKDEIEVVPYPSFEPQGLGFTPGIEYGICESSKNKKEAWSFIELQFSRQNQLFQTGAGEIPMDQKCLEEYIKRMTVIDGYMDEDQQFIEPVSGEFTFGDVVIKQQPASLEEAKKFRTLLDSIDHQCVINDTVFKIILEEAKYYFEGQKSAAEVGKILQNRVGIYLNE